MRYSVEINERCRYDVVVCGGGPSGCAAAISARREGLSVLIVEESGQLGGMAVSGLVSQWLGGRTQEGKWVVGGLFKSLAEEAEKDGCAVIPNLVPGQDYHPYGWYNWFIHGVPVDPFKLSHFLDLRMRNDGIDVLFFAKIVDTVVSDGHITDVVVSGSEGLYAIKTGMVIDATGNADVAFHSGCSIQKGREQDGKMAPSSLIFHLYDVDTTELTASIKRNRDPKFRDLISELRRKGVWKFPYDIFICTQLTRDGEYFVNTIRLVGVDGTDGFSLSDGMMRGRAEVYELFGIMKRWFPGFANSKIKSVAPVLGVRETRRIVGQFVMKVDDLKQKNSFEDTIGFSMYGWDLPDPDKPSVQPFADDEKTGFKAKVQKGLFTPLPYRIMVPDGVSNLLCVGRTVSVEGQVLGPVRVMAPCMAMGEAAGIAVAMALKTDSAVADIDIKTLKARLKEYDCIVEESELPAIFPRFDQK